MSAILSISQFKQNIRRCRELKIPRTPFKYDHHVFVGNIDDAGCDLYHYTSKSSLSLKCSSAGKITTERLHYQNYIDDPKSKIRNIFDFSKNEEVFIVNRDDYPDNEEEENKCISRANSRLGETKYSATFNNCECYVNWIFTNNNTSKQTKAGMLNYLCATLLDGVGSNGILNVLISSLPDVCRKLLRNSYIRALRFVGEKAGAIATVIFLLFLDIKIVGIVRNTYLSPEEKERSITRLYYSSYCGLIGGVAFSNNFIKRIISIALFNGLGGMIGDLVCSIQEFVERWIPTRRLMRY